MLDGQTSHFMFEKLRVLKGKLNSLPVSLPVHLELASMAKPDLVTAILEQVKVCPYLSGKMKPIKYMYSQNAVYQTCNSHNYFSVCQIIEKVSSLGLNEQELILSSHLLGGPHKEIYNIDGLPIIHKITDTMVWLMKKFGKLSKKEHSRLTRIHFHTLTYHIIGTVPGVWGNSAGAVAAGTRKAGRQACDTPILDPEKADLKIPKKFLLHTGGEERTFSHSEPVMSFTHESLEFSFSPVLVCKKPLKTVGLGDAISATGLLYSTFNSEPLSSKI